MYSRLLFDFLARPSLSSRSWLPGYLLNRSGFHRILVLDIIFFGRSGIGKARVEGLQAGIFSQPGLINAHVFLQRDLEIGLQ